MIPATPAAYKLLMDGSQALTDVEEHGMKIDVRYLDAAIEWADNRLVELEGEMKRDKIFDIWKRAYGPNTDLSNRQQLAHVIFDKLGYQSEATEKSKRHKTGERAFDGVDEPFVINWLEYERTRRMRSTDLVGTKKLVDPDGFLHPFFHLHFVSTYRSSSSDPNFQNKPNRHERFRKIVRRAFVPRSPDHVIVEIDYAALEFRGAACVWRDPAMVEYASNSTLDIHRDIAAECFQLDVDDVTKATRNVGKNGFVFPLLYGSYYGNISKNMWAAIEKDGLDTVGGVPLKDHLADRGISDIFAFEEHIKNAEANFNERFSTWSQAKDQWWGDYLKQGEFPLLTGFVCRGVYNYNDLMNYPIQGPSFHCLLWSLIKINNWLKTNKMKSVIAGQIHDSIWADVHKSELAEYVAVSRRIMTEDIRQHWPWIITPLEVDVETSDKNWYEKKAYVK